MNKLAAEKIAQEYYDLGVQLALSKTAGISDKILRNTAGLYGAGAGAVAGGPLLARQLMGEKAMSEAIYALGKINPNSYPLNVENIAMLGGMAPAALAGGILGARGATKGYDKLVELLSRAPKKLPPTAL